MSGVHEARVAVMELLRSDACTMSQTGTLTRRTLAKMVDPELRTYFPDALASLLLAGYVRENEHGVYAVPRSEL